jgi:hypothetical protein
VSPADYQNDDVPSKTAFATAISSRSTENPVICVSGGEHFDTGFGLHG